MQNLGTRQRWVVLFLKIILVAAIVTATVLAIAQDQETVELRSAISAEDPAAAEYLAALVAADLVDGNTYDVLVNGDRVFPAMLQAIEAARERISFETYVYDEGRVADQFTDALEKAARRGVTVNVILDALGAGSMDTSHLKRLQKAGCHIVNFNPTSWYSLEELNYRTHRKILVIDGSVAFTGGVGVADHWLGNAQDAQHWRDTHVRIQGPIARMLEAAFYENFVGGGFTVTPALSHPAPAADGDDQSMVVRSSPSDGASDLKRLYLLAIAMARRSIDISSPYFVTDESTIWALDDARKRGVTIRILVESDITDHRSVKYASRAAYTDLLERGIADPRILSYHDAHQDAGGRRPAEYLRIGELRQPIARTERRGECCRHEPAAGEAVCSGLRTGPAGVTEVVTGDLARTAIDGQGARTLLELFWRNVLTSDAPAACNTDNLAHGYNLRDVGLRAPRCLAGTNMTLASAR